MPTLRSLENRFYRSVRDPDAADAAQANPGPWDITNLRGHKYCLLTSYRKNGVPVNTPVWFGTAAGNLYIRSGAEDLKMKRIRRTPHVLITPCGARGKPLGRPMEGSARILEPPEYEHAERALRRRYGLGRRLYRLLRRRIDVAYLEVAGSR